MKLILSSSYPKLRQSPYVCMERCKNSELRLKIQKQYGQTYQQLGGKYCKECEVHFKVEVGLKCPCCKRRLTGRIRSKASKKYREKVHNQAFLRQLERSEEDRETQKALLTSYHWWECRTQCNFKTDDLVKARQHKQELGHGIKHHRVEIHSLLATQKEERNI